MRNSRFLNFQKILLDFARNPCIIQFIGSTSQPKQLEKIMEHQQNYNYRAEGNHLYKKQKDGSFLHVYQDPMARGLNLLIAAYERHCEEDFINGDSSAYDEFK